MRVKSLEEIFAEIGFGSMGVNSVLNRLVEAKHRPETRRPRTSPPDQTADHAAEGVRVAGLGNTLVRISRCCLPVPGDEVRGFVTRGRGVSVHKESCPNFRRMILNPQNADREVEVTWDPEAKIRHEIAIRVVARDRAGLLADLTNVISERGIFIQSSLSRSNRDSTATLRFKLMVNSSNQLNAVMESLRRVKGVRDITRAGADTG
jgi:GTP pyrophosphokinase